MSELCFYASELQQSQNRIVRFEYLKKQEHELDEEIANLRELKADKYKIMEALHKYNDVKDAAQVVLGRLANIYGVTTSELHKKFDLPTEE